MIGRLSARRQPPAFSYRIFPPRLSTPEVSAVATTELPALDPLDFLALDALLDGEERAIRDTVRQFVREQVLPEVGDWFERGILPRELLAELAKLGLFGMHLEGYGCAGASAVAYGLTCLELEAGDTGVRSAVSVQGSLAMYAIWRWGSEEQKELWLPRMAAGEVIGCFGLTEPDAGSDPGAMRTHARRHGSDWVLNGTKMWITNGSIADIAIVWARTDGGEIRGFVVERGMPGFTAPEIHKKLSLRASVTSELVLADVRVPGESMLPGASSLRGPLSCLNEARYGIVWGAVGAGRACFEAALAYAKERIVFGKPIAAYQLTQQKLAEMALELSRGSLVALHIGRLKDAGTLRPEHVSLGKMGNVRGALEVARSARTILGGNGITLEYPVIRHMNNLESVLTYEGTHEVHTLVVGQALTGENAFR
ncbi:MAG: acyl-CoA dehydrogenase family protein [Actinobacteria bacterium]|nr:acyl-CoA dehydrogenase family protein [Actinomycetota bacterium]